MMQDRLFQAARFLCDRIKSLLAFSRTRSFLSHRRNWYTLEDDILEEITSGFLLRLELGVVPCEGVQAEITGVPAVVRVGRSMERGKVCDEQ